MRLFDFNDLVILGPGSEWLWTFIQALALTVTFVAIYRQLRAARAANEFRQVREVAAEFDSPRMIRARLSIYDGLLHGRKPEQGLPDGGHQVLCWYDDLGYLVEVGNISARWFHASWGTSIQNEWWLLRPYVEHDRVARDDPSYGRSFEHLAARMRERDRRAGIELRHDEAQRPKLIEVYASLLASKLRFALPAERPR